MRIILADEPVDPWHCGAPARTRFDPSECWSVLLGVGAPGLRPEYSDTYYAAFVVDPNGNNIEAVFHGDAASHKGERQPR